MLKIEEKKSQIMIQIFFSLLFHFCCRNTRTHKNMSESTIEKENLATVIRPPGSINGQQIIVQNCEKSTICILDHLDCATIDECKDCTIFMGPTRGR